MAANVRYIRSGAKVSLAIESVYRVINSLTELKNVFAATPPTARIIPIMKFLDKHTFQPLLAFMIFNPFGHEYYVVPLCLTEDAGAIEFTILDAPGMEMDKCPNFIPMEEKPVEVEAPIDERTPEDRTSEFQALLETTGIPMPEGKLII